MRRALAIQCCLAFVTAFVLAPFQHVHRAGPGEGHHDHTPLIHSHLSAHHHDHVDVPGEREIESADEDQPVSLDTFTLVLTAHLAPFVPTRAPALVQALAETRLGVDVVEERGNSPPARRNSSPRAPPA
jgi:hypothetical protein